MADRVRNEGRDWRSQGHLKLSFGGHWAFCLEA